MMNLGRGSSIPREKAVVLNSDHWVPVTPEKPIVLRSGNASVEIRGNQRGSGDWSDLLNIYSEVLQDTNCNNSPVGLVSEYHGERKNTGQAPAEMVKSFNHDNGIFGPYVQNIRNSAAPQKVDTLAELMSLRNDSNAFPTNRTSIRNICVPDKCTSLSPHSQVISNLKGYGSASWVNEQNHSLYTDQNIAQSKTLTGGVSIPYRPIYNLNLPPRLEAVASSSTSRSSQVEPATPDQQRQANNYRLGEVTHFLLDDVPIQEKDRHEFVSQQPEIMDGQCNQILQETIDKSSSAISKMPEENNICDVGNLEGIDLNKTPQHKPPKRRKHRPKVVVEGKPKRTPKSSAPKSTTADGNSSGKRKYVRRKNIETSTTGLKDSVKEVEGSNVQSVAKSCRKMLNFDLEDGTDKNRQDGEVAYQAQKNDDSKPKFNLNLDSQDAECFTGFNSTSTVRKENKSVPCIEKQQTENSCRAVDLTNQVSCHLSLPLAATGKDHTLNVLARSLSMRNTTRNHSCDLGMESLVHNYIGGGLAQFAVQAENKASIAERRQLMLDNRTQFLEESAYITAQAGSKRDYSNYELEQPRTVMLMGSQLLYHQVPHTGHHYSDNIEICQDRSEMQKRKKVDDMLRGKLSNMPSGISTVESFAAHVAGRGTNNLQTIRSTMHLAGRWPNSEPDGRRTSRQSNDIANITCISNTNPTDSVHSFNQQNTSSQVRLCSKQRARKVSNHTTKTQNANDLALTMWNPAFPIQRDPKFIQGDKITNSLVHMPRQGQTILPSQALHQRNWLPQESKNAKGSQEKGRCLFSVEDIIDCLSRLKINNNGKGAIGKEQNAIVPYKRDGAVVPYEQFDPIKRRKPRPKVDLDPETNRLWNLLMGKEGSESAEAMDKDKQQWWEEERKVFRGRVDSFIARMHLVQGDRRFSKWKGSVVDSVIGVFLTQNVSDHLSSSAFMSLAAKFPLKSTSNRRKSCQSGGSAYVEEPKVKITFPDEATTHSHGLLKQPVYTRSSLTLSELTEYHIEDVMIRPRPFLMKEHNRRVEDDVFSSQSSSESFIFQGTDDIRSSSGSNSECEDQIVGCNFSKIHGPNPIEPAERDAIFQGQRQAMGISFPDYRVLPQHQKDSLYKRQTPGDERGSVEYAYPVASYVLHSQTPDVPSTSSQVNTANRLEEWERKFLDSSVGQENLSSLASTDDDIGQSSESSYITQLTSTPKYQASKENHASLSTYLEQQITVPAGSESRRDQHSVNIYQGRGHENFQCEKAALPDCIGPAQENPRDNLTRSMKKTAEPSAVNQQGQPPNQIGTATPNTRKRKVEKEKMEEINWDRLRIEAERKVGRKERSWETMDSLDYEALRNAEVHEISQTIKERGMNNMLAERMKDFLDRLVQDHGGMDLEWLRDAPPEQAKDYLLSIRGLGLKSVECVRLLTLHHLAFPVDTNVGRIAVRLGWVPLQPLPESLQLHLLELYPVLESIQKYLWPRLCKLDQETLYELHYQMITFGKVFCTKREPNCNACPMRGECRHFASAFASARLALPGPEEKRVVRSTASSTAGRIPDSIINPMPLPLADCSLNTETRLNLENCEPIIEEPKTPEPHVEVSETDIEEAFYEDPDEIPTIKLNIEEFTTNLQSFMQEHMEMQEGDMSNALVALSPGLASIPMPKLKNVSRLRTEHQVYELPDGHPLLKGLDRREPDDPSPYLLAIWTPGETADSIQPPESKCSCQESGGLCDRTTCFSCNSIRETQLQTVRGTILIPCRTATRGSFPLNGTYFQVNELFADHESSLNPINVSRSLLWNLPRRTVFFGTSVSTIFKGLSTEGIQYCFWKGFVCVRGFDRESRAPRPLIARLHFPASKMVKRNEKK